MKEKFDLHVHSNLSDGLETRKKLIEIAKSKNFQVLAFTDHNISGMDVTTGLQKLAGDTELISGIEIDCGLPFRMHILGYYLIDGKKIDDILEQNLLENEERCYQIVRNLNARYNFNITDEDIQKFKTKYFTKRDINHILLDKKIINHIYEASNKYMGQETPDYIPMKKVSSKEALQLILNSGGIPVLAHPVTVFRDQTLEKFEPLLRKLVNGGLMGIEVVNKREDNKFQEYFLLLARKYHLITTVGTDFHRFNRDEFGVELEPEKVLYPLLELGKKRR